MRLNWNFQRGWGVLIKNPFCGGGMDILWNYTIARNSFEPPLMDKLFGDAVQDIFNTQDRFTNPFVYSRS